MTEQKLYTLKDIRSESVYFPSMRTLLIGAIRFTEFFISLHTKGCVYCGNDPYEFSFDVKSGEVYPKEQIVTKEMEEGVPGARVDDNMKIHLSEFLAPELVLAMDRPEDLLFTPETDRYFLAVFLFEYFYHTGSPFEGKKMVNRCFLSPREKELYRAEYGKFCMEPGDDENAPVRGIQDSLIRYWDLYPKQLGKMFMKAFLSGGSLTDLRPSAAEWKHLLIQLLMDEHRCSCGFMGFSGQLVKNDNGTAGCPVCGKICYPLNNMKDTIWLTEGKELYACQTGKDSFDYETVTAVVVENKKQKGLYGLKNTGSDSFFGTYPDGGEREITPGQALPIWNGMKLWFVNDREWTLQMNAAMPADGKDEENEQ